VGEFTVRVADRPGDLGWMVMAHGELYAAEYGWDTTFEAHVARLVADFATAHDPSRERAWIAELDGRRLGCVACTATDQPDTAQLRILLLHPDARGQRLGVRLVDTCLAFARAAGYRRVRLWTTNVLTAARSIYVAAGFRLVEQTPQQWAGARVIGEDYELDLAPPGGPG
jgi:N-acetylglutamate synthase-like GNAT family acetyltransferase